MTTTPLTDQQLAAELLLKNQLAAAFEHMDAYQWGYDHGFCGEYGVDPETDSFVDTALALVRPDLDRLAAELATSRSENTRLCGEITGARATIDHMSKAMSWICGHDRQGLDHLEEAQREVRGRESAVKEARRWAARTEQAEAELGRVRAELTRRRTDDLNIRGALAPTDGPRHVPMALGDSVTPAVEWLIAELDRLRAELETLRAGAVEREGLLTEARDALEAAGQGGAHGDDWPAVAPAISALTAERDRLRVELADTVRFRDFHARSVGHLAHKRDRAEQLISRYRDGRIVAESVIDRVARTLSVEGDEAPPPPAG